MEKTYIYSTFRGMQNRTFLVNAANFRSSLKEMDGIEEADYLLAYCYVDHNNGVLLEFLSCVTENDGSYHFFEPNNSKSSIVSIENFHDVPLEEIEVNDEKYAQKIEKINSRIKEEFKETRTDPILDGFRDLYHVDDLLVHFHQFGKTDAVYRVRVELKDKDFYYGQLLSDAEEFGLKKDSCVKFRISRNENDLSTPDILLCNLDVNDSVLSRVDLSIAVFEHNSSIDNLMDLYRILRESDVILACMEGERDERGLPVANLLNIDDEFYMAVFTSEEHLGLKRNSISWVELPFSDVIDIINHHEREIKAIVLNPFSTQIDFDLKMLDAFEVVYAK